MNSAPRILSVGQCSADDYRLAHFLRAHARGYAIDSAGTADEAFAMIGQCSYALILVNRVLDGDGGYGVDFISRVRGGTGDSAEGGPVVLMLLSDFAEAQAQAVAAGASLGFGKSQLGTEQAGQAVRRALNRPPD